METSTLFLSFSILATIDILLYTNVFTVFTIIQSSEIEGNLMVPYDEGNCPFPHFNNDILYPNYTYNENPDEFSKRLQITKGGKWWPNYCKPKYKLALIIPFRNRHNQLKIFLSYMHPFLQSQNIDYRIFVVEQTDKSDFNRGKLFNIGFLESKKYSSSTACYIFHDVDLIPQNLNNVYACTKMPRHMSSSVNKDRYILPYDTYFGGVFSILSSQFKDVNGFSNKFYGWGGEDDDFYNRIRSGNFGVCRFESDVSRYYALNHKKEKPAQNRYEMLAEGSKEYLKNGLNDLTYTLVRKEYLQLYTRILVDV